MEPLDPLLATAATLVIFFGPGMLLVAVFNAGSAGNESTERLTLGEQFFVMLSGSLVVSGWVALVTAELGRFSPLTVAIVLALGLVVATLLLRRRLATGLHGIFGRGRLPLDEVLVLGGLLAFALLVYFPPFEYILGGKDPGVYVNTGFHLAREGNIRFVDPLVGELPTEARALFYRVDKSLPDWSQDRYLGFYMESPETARVLPQGFHLYPVWIGLASGLFEMKAGLYATPFFALMGVAAYFFAIRRLFGSAVAVGTTAFLATFQIQVWFARFPNAEVVFQFLFAFALWAFYFMQERRSVLGGALAGAAIGSILLVRLEGILFIVPVALYMGWQRLRRNFGKPECAFLVPFLLLGAHTVLHAKLFAIPYVASVFGRWYWRWVAEHMLVLALLGALLFFVGDRYFHSVSDKLTSLARRPSAGHAAAGMIFLLAGYAYFVRPVFHATRTAPHDAEAFFRMSWYLYPMGVALVVAGVMFLLARPERRWWFFVLVGLTFSVFFFYKIRVSNDHFFGMRRFVPIILPVFFTAISYLLVRLGEGWGRAGRLLSILTGVLLVTVYTLEGRPLWTHNEFRGSIDFMEELARYIGDEDVVLFPRREGLHLLELPLAELEGKKVLEFYTLSPDRDRLERLLAFWRNRYQDVYFVTNYKVSLSGIFTRHVKDFLLPSQIYEYTYLGPPKKAIPFHLRFTLSKAVDLDRLAEQVPETLSIDVGATQDDPLLAWFHQREMEDGLTYRWSQRVSSVFLPNLSPERRRIRIRLAGPRESQAPLSEVRLRLNDVLIGAFIPGRDFEEFEFPIPAELSRRLDQIHAVLHIETTPWRPQRLVPEATDIRELGVRVDWIHVE